MSQRIADIRMTADEYDQLGRAGLLDPTRRLELLEGEIYDMSPTGSRHLACVNRLSRLFHRIAGTELIVSIQNPIRLSDLSEPVPDVSILNFRDDDYEDALPKAGDVKLLIEVADSSVGTDRTIKLNLYALAGIPEVWLANLRDKSVELFVEPSKGSYLTVTQYSLADEVTSRSLPNVSIKVSDIFRKYSD